MDEPTSSITDKEVDNLFNMIRNLKSAGVGIIYISHKMDEIFQICDEMTILRDGTYIDTFKASEVKSRHTDSKYGWTVNWEHSFRKKKFQ